MFQIIRLFLIIKCRIVLNARGSTNGLFLYMLLITICKTCDNAAKTSKQPFPSPTASPATKSTTPRTCCCSCPKTRRRTGSLGTWTTLGRVVTGLPRLVRGWCSKVKVVIRIRSQNLKANWRYLVIKTVIKVVGYCIDLSNFELEKKN